MTRPAYSFVQHNHLRRRNPEIAGGYCRWLSGLTYEQRESVRLELLKQGIRCLAGRSLITDTPYNHFVAVHTDENFFAARRIAETVLRPERAKPG